MSKIPQLGQTHTHSGHTLPFPRLITGIYQPFALMMMVMVHITTLRGTNMKILEFSYEEHGSVHYRHHVISTLVYVTADFPSTYNLIIPPSHSLCIHGPAYHGLP